MKKLLALVLVLVLCVSFLVACDPKETISSVTGSIKDKVGNLTGSIKDKINGLLGKEPDNSGEKTALDSAVTYIFDLYREKPAETPANYDLVSVVTIDGVTFSVTWTTDNELITIAPHEKDENLVTVVVPEAGDEDVAYVLTATIADADENTKTKSFDRVVPKLKIFTAKEYYDAEAGKLVTVEGIVTGIASKSQGSYNTLYLNDLKGEGAYYIYSFADKDSDLINDLGIKIGMTVRVSGTKDVYNGTHELKDCYVKITNSKVQSVTPVDYTDIFKNAADLKDEALVGKQGMLVTIKGVTIGDVGDNGYRHFTLGNKTSYVRISSSSNCMSKDDVTKFEADFVANKGNIADVTGVISVYNEAFYLIPVSVNAYSNIVVPDRSDAEKVEFELGNIEITDKVAADTEITLPAAGTKYTNVKFAWTVNGEAVTDGKISVVLGDEVQTITLKVVASIEGSASKEATYTIAVDALKKGAVNLTVDTLGLGEYNAEEESKTVFGFGFSYIQLGSYGDGIQMRDSEKEGVMRTSRLWNTTALGKGIKGITLTINPTKSAYDNTDAIIFTFGNAADALTYTTKLSTVKDQMVYTVTPDVATYTFFKLEYDFEKSAYWESIVIEFEAEEEVVITDEEKVAVEKNALNLKKTEFAEDGTLTLPTTPVMFNEVAITWTANGEPVANNVVDIVLTKEEQTIVLIATITSGEATDTKEFTVKVAKMPVIQIEEVTALEVDVPYKFYLNQVKNGEKLYFNGNPESESVTYRLETTNAIGKALDVKLEYAYAEDKTTVLGYRIYFEVDKVKTYIRMYERTEGTAGYGKGSLEFVTETPAEYYTYHETYKTLILTCVATDSTEDAPKYNTYYLGTHGDFDTISVNNTSYIKDNNLETSGGQYPTHFVTFYCLHDYTSDCDVECNECKAVRTDAPAAHTYAGDCDATCDLCAATRETNASHTYEKACSETCTVCGFVRDDATHTAAEDAVCTADVLCSVCGKKLADAKAEHVPATDDGDCTTPVKCTNTYCTHVVTAGAAEHTFDGCEGTECTADGCDETRVAPGHLYDNACDKDCNVCGEANPNVSNHVDNEVNATGAEGKDSQCDNCGMEVDETGDTEEVPVN